MRTALLLDLVGPPGVRRLVEDVDDQVLLRPDDVEACRESLRSADAVLVQLQQPGPAVAAALDACAEDALVVADGAPADEDTRRRVLSRADVVRADSAEIQGLVGWEPDGEQDVVRAAQELLSQGPRVVALSVSGGGDVVAWPGGHVVLPLLGEEAVDPTGGGDSLAEQRRVLDDFWDAADVELDGDPELQQALRFDLFQLLQASACVNAAPVGAKGLTGYGYSGHTFWDIDGFLIPSMALLRPQDAVRMLRWRSSGLEQARERAQVLGLEGASFPWRTIDGGEASAYWPASTAAAHINADAARGFTFWADATGGSLEDVGGLDVLVETARVWARMLHRDHEGRCHLYGMTGPDEYTGVDDNVFTNLMAARNLRWAADACDGDPAAARRLQVTTAELARWREAADSRYVPYDEVLGVHQANEGFTTYREWDFEDRQDAYPVQNHAHYAKIYRRQVIKQADLELALWWCSDAFTPEETARNLDYYEARTVRDSSLSAAAQAVVCARAGHLDLALAYLREAAFVDLRDLQQDSEQGLHLASLAGAWLALVCGLGGLQIEGGDLQLSPRLPARLGRIAFRFQWRGHRLGVETSAAGTVVRLLDELPATTGLESEIVVSIDGKDYKVAPGQPAVAPLCSPDPLLPTPAQPLGRAPDGM